VAKRKIVPGGTVNPIFQRLFGRTMYVRSSSSRSNSSPLNLFVYSLHKMHKGKNNGVLFICTHVSSLPKLFYGFRRNMVLRLPGEFNFGSCRSSIISSLYEAQVKLDHSRLHKVHAYLNNPRPSTSIVMIICLIRHLQIL